MPKNLPAACLAASDGSPHLVANEAALERARQPRSSRLGAVGPPHASAPAQGCTPATAQPQARLPPQGLPVPQPLARAAAGSSPLSHSCQQHLGTHSSFLTAVHPQISASTSPRCHSTHTGDRERNRAKWPRQEPLCKAGPSVHAASPQRPALSRLRCLKGRARQAWMPQQVPTAQTGPTSPTQEAHGTPVLAVYT